MLLRSLVSACIPDCLPLNFGSPPPLPLVLLVLVLLVNELFGIGSSSSLVIWGGVQAAHQAVLGVLQAQTRFPESNLFLFFSGQSTLMIVSR